MTISSEISNYLIHLKRIKDLDFLHSIISVIKLTISLLFTPFSSFLSFHWLNDLLFRINTLPAESTNILNQPFLGPPQLNLFQEHISNPIFFNPLMSGCLNAFFLCLPLSISHLYSIKETVTNNTKVGSISLLSTVFGIFTYSFFIKTNGNFIIEGWTKGDSFVYVLAISILLFITYKQSDIDVITINTPGSISFQTNANWKDHFLLPFGLSWIEQIVCFPYLNSIGDPINNLYAYQDISNICFYLVGIGIGAFFGICVFSVGLKQLCQLLWNFNPINPRIWRENSNTFFNTVILIFTFSTLPYYTLDYLTTNSIGFHSKEKIVQKNLITHRDKIKDTSVFLVLNNMDIESFDTKPTYINPPTPIEDMVYRSEKDVVNRTTRQSSTVEENAKNFMQNILNKLGIQIKPAEVEPKTGEEQRKTTKGNKATFTNFTPPTIVARRFQQYSKLGVDSLAPIVTNTAFVDATMTTQMKGTTANIKRRYYDNPVYQTLLNGDINLFLWNQPKNQYVTENEFSNILKTQKALKDYNNSIRKYRSLPYQNDFYTFFHGSKSFSNKLVSHQAKGSLRIVRRLFRIDIDRKEKDKVKKYLSYDQPLYSNGSLEKTKQNFIHEELMIHKSTNLNLKTWNPTPLYVGWDEKNHEYLITNRYLNQNSTRKESSKIKITSFPVQAKENYQSRKSLNNLLSIPSTDFRLKKLQPFFPSSLNYNTIPITVTLYQQPEQFLPPDRGVFLWNNE
uniref:Hypothetical chloroplast RF1 n=1 Tax=Marsupiomonas sp. NIES 1824 TaxID=1562198 RepID=A0A097KLZ4_9CHLO|nr:hypothetical chloroplast RF1 [Marsupiomonas sp. NIES 1824]